MSQPVYTSSSAEAVRAVAAARPAATRPARKAAAAPAIASAPTPAMILTDPRLPGVEIGLELITPDLADHYLSKLPTAQSMIKQRSQSSKTVDRYSGDMAAEAWPFTGDPIRFNTLGELIDGQHRLQAVSKAGTSEMMIVIRGLEPETFIVFDTGRARSFTDALRSMGISNVSMVAGVTRRVFHWRRGNFGVDRVGRVPNAQFLGVPASASGLLETFAELRTEIIAASRRGGSFKAAGFANKTAAPAVVAFVYMLFSRIDRDRCEGFFHELQFGPAQNGPSYPIFVLRDRLHKKLPDHVAALPDWVWIHFFFHTWNKWIQAESMGTLKTPPSSSYSYLAKPIDPHAADRPEGWEPLGGVTA